MRPSEQFDKAFSTVTQDRGKNYGHPKINFDRIARLQAVVQECPDPLVRSALDMICVKIARLIETPDHIDSLVDIAGYARTIAMVHDRRHDGLTPLSVALREAVEKECLQASAEAYPHAALKKSPDREPNDDSAMLANIRGASEFAKAHAEHVKVALAAGPATDGRITD